MSALDPKPTFIFLQSRRSARLAFCATELHEAAVGGLTLPAICGHSTSETIGPLNAGSGSWVTRGWQAGLCQM